MKKQDIPKIINIIEKIKTVNNMETKLLIK